ncbi:MAG: beta galactosidase jelly roll domain-containing protein [Opitutae bacterium]|nr:beta galactosidase jelly roll domain-containing protein [Opitutae bacterium]
MRLSPLSRFQLAAAGCLALTIASARLGADVIPASLFCDHAVLQQGLPVPVWGTADEGEQVAVEFAGQHVSTTAHDGRWLVRLAPLQAGGPHTLTITGRNRVVISDVLVGEVWVCSGQSNMERHLGPQEGQLPLVNWELAVAAADLPQIRHFGVAHKITFGPETAVDGQWLVCSPATAPEFTAVGFYFGRAIHQARGVPVGLIHSSWGGTPAEAWMSGAALDAQPDYATARADQELARKDPAAARARFEQNRANWYAQGDPGQRAAVPWNAPQADETGWGTMQLPAEWEKAGLPDYDGLVWFRREFELPADWAGHPADLHLGAIDDADTTWVNGQQVGATHDWQARRVYPVPAVLLHPGRNVVAVRVLDTGGGGGLWGNGDAMRLTRSDDPTHAPISLSGAWRYRAAATLESLPPLPLEMFQNANVPGVLFNGMIAPLQPYAIRGVIWYQGETNSGRSRQYRTLFPALIADWRRGWGEGDFPFLFVQIAPHDGMVPGIREAQLLAWQNTPNTAMAVTLDVGNETDIHPANKQPVGERLALAARALAYGEQLEYSGPVYASAEFKAGRAVLHFTHVGGGLVAPGGELHGFTVAGADQVFHPAQAMIVGDTIEVSAEGVTGPVAVRYAWANFAQGNLYNRTGLPASPFRTDVD